MSFGVCASCGIVAATVEFPNKGQFTPGILRCPQCDSEDLWPKQVKRKPPEPVISKAEFNSVLTAMETGSVTAYQMAKATEIPIYRLNNILRNLERKHKVHIVSYKLNSPSGKRGATWALTERKKVIA